MVLDNRVDRISGFRQPGFLFLLVFSDKEYYDSNISNEALHGQQTKKVTG